MYSRKYYLKKLNQQVKLKILMTEKMLNKVSNTLIIYYAFIDSNNFINLKIIRLITTNEFLFSLNCSLFFLML